MNQPLAYVHPGAKIAKNVVVEPFATISSNVIIGEGTWVGSNVTIMEGARIGKNCNIYPGAVISGVPQDLKFEGEESLCEIGDNTTIRECVTINRGTKDRGTTKIGSNCLIMAYSHVAHDCFVGDNCIFSNSSTLAGHITVDDYVILSGFVAVHQFCKVQEIQNIYRFLYQKKYNNTQAMEIIQAELNATPERDEIIQFIENSQRGIMKGYFQKN